MRVLDRFYRGHPREFRHFGVDSVYNPEEIQEFSLEVIQELRYNWLLTNLEVLLMWNDGGSVELLEDGNENEDRATREIPDLAIPL